MNNTCPPITEFDQLTLGNSTQMIKAILPYFDFKTQQKVSLIIRIQELRATIEYYRKHASAAFSNHFQSNFSQKDLLDIIKIYYPDSNIDMINNFNTFMQMENVMSAMNSNQTSDDFNTAQSMMNPRQQHQYEAFLKELEEIDFESEVNNE